mmetsp:Transcript_23784/g.30965  ORF Transcript_23784/g.30965 Transcript_23784/m.30965 type:complete len:148 (-) Transcript_23784:443-886(-)
MAHNQESVIIKLIDAERIESSSPEEKTAISSIIDEYGLKSAQAQSIKLPMTTYSKFLESDHRMYIAYNQDEIPLGFLRVGMKHLYYYDRKGKCMELDPLCVLDFYVSEDHQRKGIGLSLVNFMLQVFFSSFFFPPLLLQQSHNILFF